MNDDTIVAVTIKRLGAGTKSMVFESMELYLVGRKWEKQVLADVKSSAPPATQKNWSYSRNLLETFSVVPTSMSKLEKLN